MKKKTDVRSFMKKLSPEEISEVVRVLLEKPAPPPLGLQWDATYSRLHDDHDGTKEGFLEVFIGPDGDIHLAARTDWRSLRFRNILGGGGSLRVHNALVILAEAIRQENEINPCQFER